MANYILFITEEYLKKNTNITQNVDVETLRPSMMKAQDLYITPFLGKDLDSEIKTALSTNSLSPIQSELISLIRKAQAEFTAFLAYTDILVKFMNKGAVQGGIQNGNISVREDIIYLRDITKNQAEAYLQYVLKFLKDNKDSFPAFFNSCDSTKKSGFKFQIEYDKKIRVCDDCGYYKCQCYKFF